MQHINFNNIGKICYGRGSFSQLDEILEPKRQENNGNMIFLVDDYFEGKELANRIPVKGDDLVYFIDASHEEPKTSQIDELRDEILAKQGLPSGIVGIGGGSIMDIAKALSLMMTNEGSSTLYQGLNLIKKPGIYHCGVPTISGTGAECSMTAVLSGPEKKLGLKCEWTVFNQVVLDPELTATVPTDQWFYTGMDTFIHCIESATGIKYNAFSKAYGDQAIQLCEEIFLGENAGQNPENDEKLMLASLFGGLSLTYSEVGVCHALSYGLGFVFGTRHGYANCLAFNHLEDVYGPAVKDFQGMLERFNIELPQNLSASWTDEEITAMAEIAIRLEHMWHHAFGENWKDKVNMEYIEGLYRRM
jgi:3-deoxy-alpha-D-manno-octulosonate 8-oxidase